MRIITDSAADFTNEELKAYDITCVRTQVFFGDECFTPGVDLSEEQFWQRMLAGETAKTSQPSPEAFLSVFEKIKAEGEEAVYISISSALSGTIQSANLAVQMAEYDKIHIVDSRIGAAGQKLLVLHACRLRDEGKLKVRELVQKLEQLCNRVRLFAGVDTLENLGRSGRIPKAVASLGNIAHLKPLLEVSPEGKIVLGGKALGRRRAIEHLAKKISSFKIDENHPVIPLFSYSKENCLALIEKLRSMGVRVDEDKICGIGTSVAPHIGPGAYGVTFIEAE